MRASRVYNNIVRVRENLKEGLGELDGSLQVFSSLRLIDLREWVG